MFGVAGFIVSRAWGFWVNMSHGTEMGALASLIQASCSFVADIKLALIRAYKSF
jgi:hypothetical protein